MGTLAHSAKDDPLILSSSLDPIRLSDHPASSFSPPITEAQQQQQHYNTYNNNYGATMVFRFIILLPLLLLLLVEPSTRKIMPKGVV